MELTLALFFAIIVILLAGLVQGLAGFGFSQFALPLLVLVMISQELIPMMVVLSLFLNLFLVYELRKDIQLKRIWPLMLGGILGIPIGTYLLLIADTGIMKLLIGLVIIIFGLAQLFEIRKTVKNEKLAMGPIGFAGGILNGSVSMSGPPLIIFFSNQKMGKQEFRANLIAFFMFINLVTLPVFLFAGLLTSEIITISGILLPGLIVGAFIGSKLALKIDEARFKKMTTLLIIFMGCLSLASGLGLF
ncbi:MAG: sulfite exporter TauE/SafE family protein [Thermoplasmata archaeon]|nr:sulfite exporter TauE/SafE family protein [Thermoplasmata archaeon]